MMPLPTDPDTLRVPAFMRKRNIKSRRKKRLILTALDRKHAGLPPEGFNRKETVTLPNLAPENSDSQSLVRQSLAGATNSRIDEAPGFARTTRRKPRPKYARAIRRTRRSRLISRPKKVKPISITKPIFKAGPKVTPKSKTASRAKATSRKKVTPAARMTPKAKSRITPFETFSAPLLDSYDFEPSIIDSAPEKAPSKKSSKQLKQKKIGTMTHYYDKIKVGVIKLSGTLEIGDCITYDTAEGPYEEIVESMEIDRKPVFKAGRGKEVGLKLRKKPRDGCVVFIVFM